MGANSTQAQAVALFWIAFVLIAGAFAANFSVLYLILGLVVLGASVALFMKCKPWEHNEE